MFYNILILNTPQFSVIVILEQFIWYLLCFNVICFGVLAVCTNTKVLQMLRLTSSGFVLFSVLSLFILSSNIVQIYDARPFATNSLFGFLFFDRLALLFSLMSIFIIFLCYIYLFRTIALAIKPMLLLISFTEVLVLLCFTVRNALSFYVFFELILFPMTLLILEYGSRGRRVFASFSFFAYTFIGSVFIVAGIFWTYRTFQTLNFDAFATLTVVQTGDISVNCLWIFLLFWCGFSIKLPTMPVHLWLPEAHVEAPTTGSVILAAILLKLGGYGILRIILPLTHTTALSIRIVPFTLCVVSVFYASFLAYRHFDLKKIIAYSSIVHMNFAALAFLLESKVALMGCIISMLCHSIVSSALFFVAGFCYEKYKTRNLLYYSSLFKQFNFVYMMMFLFVVANMAFPLTISFIGETLVLCGLVNNASYLLPIMVFSLFFSGLFCFMLLYRLIYFNKRNNLEIVTFSLKNNVYTSPFAINNTLAYTSSETLILAILSVVTLLFFFCNDLFLNSCLDFLLLN